MRRREDGFTVIELVVAVAMLGAVILSVSLMFERSLITTDRVGHNTLAKTLAQEKLEELRSLPFYVSYKNDPRDVDLLDRYFPNLGTGYSAANGTFTTTDTVVKQEAPTFTRTVTLRFVTPDSTGNLLLQLPDSAYDSNNPDSDRPPAEAVGAVVTVEWQEAGRTQQMRLETVIHRSRLEDPKVDASGSALVAQGSSIAFFDGGQYTDVLALVGQNEVAFREVTGSTAQATSDILELVQREPDTNVPLRFGAVPGTASATVPNETTGVIQTATDSLSAGALNSSDGPLLTEWCGAGPACSATAEARVSPLHSLRPESKSTTTIGRIIVYGRDQTEPTFSHQMFEIASSNGSVEQASTTSDSQVTATALLSNVKVWAAPVLEVQQGYDGTVTIESMRVTARATAGATTASTQVDWEVRNLRVWDPQTRRYVGPWTFGFTSSCGGWVDDPAKCGPFRTDGLAPFDNPNPILIPSAYGGTDAAGNPATSLAIVTGATVREAQSGSGVALASAGQKNIVSITTRSDIVGAPSLSPMVLGLGDANASVTYVAHEH